MARIERIEMRLVDIPPKVRRTDAIQSFVSQETPPHARDGGCEDQGRREGCMVSRAGFRVLRFPDELIIGGLPIVIERIRAALRET